jgi:hypothetical protein
VRIEIEAPGVAAAVAEQLEAVRDGMVAPDALLEGDAAYLGGDGAPLAAVQPTVGPPGERIGDGVGILHAEALEQHLRVAVGHVVAVAIGIEEEVRHLQDKDAAMAERDAAGEIEVLDEVPGFGRPTRVVETFEDGDAVCPLGPFGRRLRHAVVDGA